MVDFQEQMARLDLQNAEFDTLTKLAECWRKLGRVAVVDDDYPEYRHYYEAAVRGFLQACSNNGREFPAATAQAPRGRDDDGQEAAS